MATVKQKNSIWTPDEMRQIIASHTKDIARLEKELERYDTTTGAGYSRAKYTKVKIAELKRDVKGFEKELKNPARRMTQGRLNSIKARILAVYRTQGKEAALTYIDKLSADGVKPEYRIRLRQAFLDATAAVDAKKNPTATQLNKCRKMIADEKSTFGRPTITRNPRLVQGYFEVKKYGDKWAIWIPHLNKYQSDSDGAVKTFSERKYANAFAKNVVIPRGVQTSWNEIIKGAKNGKVLRTYVVPDRETMTRFLAKLTKDYKVGDQVEVWFKDKRYTWEKYSATGWRKISSNPEVTSVRLTSDDLLKLQDAEKVRRMVAAGWKWMRYGGKVYFIIQFPPNVRNKTGAAFLKALRSGTAKNPELKKYHVWFRVGGSSTKERDVWAESEAHAKRIIKTEHAGNKIVIDKVRGYVNGILQNPRVIGITKAGLRKYYAIAERMSATEFKHKYGAALTFPVAHEITREVEKGTRFAQFWNFYTTKLQLQASAKRGDKQRAKNFSNADFRKFTKDRLLKLSKMFQGTANGATVKTIGSDAMPNDTFRLGYLVRLIYKDKAGKRHTINFDGDAFVSGDLRCNLWFSGKDARIQPSTGLPKKPNMVVLGDLVQVEYVTAKRHIENGETVRFWHPLGEVTRAYPKLAIDYDGFPLALGGGYDIWDVGIVN